MKRVLRRLKSQFFRAADIGVSAVVICFLAPVFVLVAIVSLMQGRNSTGIGSLLTSLGFGQLSQLLQVFSGEISLFERETGR